MKLGSPKHPKRYPLDLYFGPKIPLGLLWPSEDDEDDEGDEDEDEEEGDDMRMLRNRMMDIMRMKIMGKKMMRTLIVRMMMWG